MRVINRIVPALYAIKAEYMTNKVYCSAERKVYWLEWKRCIEKAE